MKKTVAVIGSGTMGNGIAHVFAQSEYDVRMMDVNDDALSQALSTIRKNFDRMVAKGSVTEEEARVAVDRIKTFNNIEAALKDVFLVVEAATENLELKLDIFRQMDRYAPKNAILATNTSSISITQIASATKRPGQVIGMHFMNPVPIMKLVEVIKGYATREEVANEIVSLSKDLGKTPTLVHDYPGFISNRILMPMINEAIESLFQGVAGVQEIDTVMKLGMAHPMGPLQLADFIGLDVCLAILRVLQEGFGNPKYAPCPLLVNMVNAGKLGVKSGEGFYDYTENRKAEVVAEQFRP